jgi:putative DNA primase/helicase
LALRFAHCHADDLRYVAFRSSWLLWDRWRWVLDDTLAAFDHARVICRDAAATTRKAKLANALASAKTVAAVERLARSDRRLAATAEQWDNTDEIFNTPEATIELLAGLNRPARREDYSMKSSAVAPAEPGTPCPLWIAFLKRVTNDDTELIAFLQRFLGYCLTGYVNEHVLVFLFGTGANGKSVFVSTVTGIFNDYAVAAPMDMFLESRLDRHPTEIAKLKGARLVVAHETQKGRRWDEAKIKNLTGGDRLPARFMRGDFFDFRPTHKLLIDGNHKPSLRNVDEAIKRRILLVPFTVQIPEAERDTELANKLKAEWPAILRWMVDGCLEWRRVGLRVPDVVRRATDDYLADQDTFAQWADEWLTADPRAFTLTRTLFKSWKQWCEERNLTPGTETAFADSLKDRGYEHHRKTSGRGFNGIALKSMNEPSMQLERR